GFGDVGLEAFGVALVEAFDVGDDAAALALGIDPDVRHARAGLHAPDGIALARVVPDVARLGVDDVLFLDASAAAEFLGERGGGGQADDLVLAGLEDVAELAGWQR